MTLIPPNGLTQVIEQFGDPRRFVLPDGTLSAAWERTYITRVDLPLPIPYEGHPDRFITQVTCHVRIADVLDEVFDFIAESDLWDKQVSYAGGFVYRPKRNGARLSLHSWGLAWDFDSAHNAMGTRGNMDPELVKIWKNYGFTWGGDFANPDPMHYQWATGY